jgi:hypothetical protein
MEPKRIQISCLEDSVISPEFSGTNPFLTAGFVFNILLEFTFHQAFFVGAATFYTVRLHQQSWWPQDAPLKGAQGLKPFLE